MKATQLSGLLLSGIQTLYSGVMPLAHEMHVYTLYERK